MVIFVILAVIFAIAAFPISSHLMENERTAWENFVPAARATHYKLLDEAVQQKNPKYVVLPPCGSLKVGHRRGERARIYVPQNAGVSWDEMPGAMIEYLHLGNWKVWKGEAFSSDQMAFCTLRPGLVGAKFPLRWTRLRSADEFFYDTYQALRGRPERPTTLKIPLCDGSGKLTAYNYLRVPDGWQIPKFAEEIPNPSPFRESFLHHRRSKEYRLMGFCANSRKPDLAGRTLNVIWTRE